MKLFNLLPILFIINLVACKQKDSLSPDNIKNAEFDSVIVDHTVYFYPDSFYSTGLSINYRYFNENTTNSCVKINEFIENLFWGLFESTGIDKPNASNTKKRIQKATNQLFESFSDYPLDNPYSFWFNYYFSNTITFNFNEITSVLFQSFNGFGSEALYFKQNYTFDNKTGECLKLSELFTDVTALTEIAEKYFREQNMGGDFNAKFTEYNYWIGDDYDDFYINENFILTPQSIEFTYSKYEIAPGSFGELYIQIPFEEVKALLSIPLSAIN
jgi:hypothetical protein